MRKNITKIVFALVICLGLTSCMPYLGGNFIARDNKFDSDGGIHSLEVQHGVTVKQLYKAIKEAIKKHPDQFEIKADDYGDQKSTIWTFSKKYKQPVTFYAMNRDGNVYLGIDIGEEGQAKESIKDIYYLEDLVLSNLNKSS